MINSNLVGEVAAPVNTEVKPPPPPPPSLLIPPTEQQQHFQPNSRGGNQFQEQPSRSTQRSALLGERPMG